MKMIAEALEVDINTPEGVKEIAARTGYETRYIYRWRAGDNGLSLSNVVGLLSSAKLLRRPGEDAGQQGSPHSILEGLVDAVADLTKSHREALADLQDVRTRLAQAEAALAPAANAPKKKRATGR